ncbi:transcriptional regulator [Actinoplanes sp. NBRC 14428]|nr:transcriptional regulator [Actinoplanes sp. NBRC 14428]
MNGDTAAPREPGFGALLKQLRTSARITGSGLADRLKAARFPTSQSRISRLETGKGAPPTQDEARAIAAALRADPESTARLMEAAQRLQQPASTWEQSAAALAERQLDTEQIEQKARLFKVFQPAVVVGLLQTSGYAGAVLSALQDVMTRAGRPAPVMAVPDAVSARVHRQAILFDPDRQFDFVMSEDVLSDPVCPPEEMLAQIGHIRQAAERENVSVSFIPSGRPLRIPLFHGFSLLDDSYLFVDLFGAGLAKQDKVEARLYQHVFDALKEQAVADLDELLTRYSRRYAGFLLAGGSAAAEGGGRG